MKIKNFMLMTGFSLVLGSVVFGQVKVGDNPGVISSNVVLELESQDKGALISRVVLDNASTEAPLAGPIAEGMLIYNNGGAEPNGFYYWDESKWERLANGTVGGLSSGSGAPSTSNPANPSAGDVYVNQSTGDLYTFDGTTWTNQGSTVSSLINNGDGSYTHTSGNGTTTTFKVTQSGIGNPTTAGVTGTAGSIYVDESTGDIYVHNGTSWEDQTGGVSGGTGAPTPSNPQGGDIYVDQSTGDVYTYDGTTWVSQSNETVTTLVDNGNGTYTYTSEDGTTTTLTSAPETVTTAVFDPATGILTYTNEAGTLNTMDISAMVANAETLTSISQDVPTGKITYTDENGAATVVDVAAMITANETTTTLVDNNDGSYTYSSEDGTTTTFAVTQSGIGNPTTTGVTGNAGDMYVDESTGDLYIHNGTSWEDQTGGVSGGAGAPGPSNPANPNAGDVYVDQSTGNLYTYDGSTWVNQSVEPSKMSSCRCHVTNLYGFISPTLSIWTLSIALPVFRSTQAKKTFQLGENTSPC